MTTITSEELKEILKLHKLYLEDEPEGIRANLTGAHLYGVNLTGVNLTRANLEGANLDGANLTRANLDGANLTRANLEVANLTGANLEVANLTGANLYRAKLTGVNLTGANLEGVNLEGVNLTGANLTGAYLYGVNLLYSKLDCIVFQFNLGKHQAFSIDDKLTIGCKTLTFSDWKKQYKKIGKNHGYTELEIEMYGKMIKTIEEMFLGKKRF